MNIKVKGNFKITKAIQQYVEDKVISRLEVFEDYIQGITVKLTNSNKENCKVEVLFYLDGQKNNRINKTVATSHDMYDAIDLVSDKCFRLMRKHKELITNKRDKLKNNSDELRLPENQGHIFIESLNFPEIEVVKIKTFDIKPMYIEEAIIQMEQLGHNFYVYLDGESNKTSVIYKRKDNKYALIETNR